MARSFTPAVVDDQPEKIIPTQHRIFHGDVILEDSPVVVVDDDGHAIERTLPYRSIDVIGALHRRGAINQIEAAAGRRFQGEFYRASLDPLRAADMARTPIGTTVRNIPGTRVERFRDDIAKAMSAIGGKCGSCAFHVIGLQITIKAWASIYSEHISRRITPGMATAILITTLQCLASHYEKTAPHGE